MLAATLSTHAYDARFYAVEMSVRAQASPPALIFSWPQAEYARQYSVRRKAPADGSWGNATTLPGTATGFSDASITAGVAYEYEVQLESTEPAPEGGSIKAYGYALAGLNVLEKERRGRVLLLVDSTVVSAITQELAEYRSDLTGAGWDVAQREVSRSASVVEVKNVIRSEHNSGGGLRSVVLIGHVPVPYSGNIAPDMHSGHRGAWPADSYYADLDGIWTDQSVSVMSVDNAENDNLPGDGKFDQSALPSPTELEIGRIDFWALPAFQNRTEDDLLRQYFRKNHQFRHRQFTAPRQGLIRDNFSDLDGDAPAVDAWRHYGTFFGPNTTREVGLGGFFPTLANEGFLWAYGCGGGANDKADGVGSTADFAASDPRAVFLMLHGSYFGDWNYPDNFLRAALASPSFTLASIWSGLPHWFLHHMALGETIGFSARLSQNNRGFYKSHRNFSAGEVHVSLIGDPTLEMFPVAPPANLNAIAAADVQLRWEASSDQNILGYHIYHSLMQNGPFTRVTPEPIAATAFAHSVAPGLHYYMVRAIKLEKTGSGTFRNLSQGIFKSVSKSTGGISTPPAVSVAVLDSEASEFRANAGSFRFTRDVVDGNALTVQFSLSGTAQNGIDYLAVEGTAIIPAWTANVTVLVYPRSDDAIEGDESVTIQLSESASYQPSPQNTASFLIRDHVANQRPAISSMADLSVAPGTAFVEAPFTISDSELPASQLSVRGVSADQTIIPDANIQFGGSDGNRTVKIIPVSGITGTARITVVVSDGALEGMQSFNVNVEAALAIDHPILRSVSYDAGECTLRFTGTPGSQCRVDASSDAATWSTLGQVTVNATGDGQFIDTRTTTSTSKIYRLVALP